MVHPAQSLIGTSESEESSPWQRLDQLRLKGQGLITERKQLLQLVLGNRLTSTGMVDQNNKDRMTKGPKDRRIEGQNDRQTTEIQSQRYKSSV